MKHRFRAVFATQASFRGAKDDHQRGETPRVQVATAGPIRQHPLSRHIKLDRDHFVGPEIGPVAMTVLRFAKGRSLATQISFSNLASAPVKLAAVTYERKYSRISSYANTVAPTSIRLRSDEAQARCKHWIYGEPHSCRNVGRIFGVVSNGHVRSTGFTPQNITPQE